MRYSNNVLDFGASFLRIYELENELREAEEGKMILERKAFKDLAPHISIGCTFNIGTQFEYLVIDVHVEKDIWDAPTPSNSKFRYIPFVWAIRVKKGTKNHIDSIMPTRAYAKLFNVKKIKEIILK